MQTMQNLGKKETEQKTNGCIFCTPLNLTIKNEIFYENKQIRHFSAFIPFSAFSDKINNISFQAPLNSK